MEIGRHDLLARHQVQSGVLKGKIVSNTSFPIQSSRRLVVANAFGIPDQSSRFKRFCLETHHVGVKDTQTLPAATHSFVESWYRGLSKYGAVLLYLTYKSGDEIYLAIKATGHWDPARYEGGRAGQMAFDDMAHHASPEINGAYRTRRYVLGALFFPDLPAAQSFNQRICAPFGGLEKLQQNPADEFWDSVKAQTRCVSARIPEKWFSTRINHFVPPEFATALDEDALRFLFPGGAIQRLLGLRGKVPGKIVVSPTHKELMLREVRTYYGADFTASTEELLNLYSGLPDAIEVPYTRELAMSVKVKCDFEIELREPNG